MPLPSLKKFLQLESASGIVLFFTAILAMIWANSPLSQLYQDFTKLFLFLINDGLMPIFFFFVGLELKRGYFEGELSTWSQVALPLMASLGGMVVPALIFVSITYHEPALLKGWATPVATDIAFALGVLSLFGSRIPISLKLFLLALAIFDDIGAILIIALFYSSGISILYLLFSSFLVFALVLLNRNSIRSLTPYFLLGFLLWLSIFLSGIHPTISGVILALTIPKTQLDRLENSLHPWVAFGIMPLFALANAGFSLQEMSWNNLLSSLVLGISAGLFIGKQIGVFLFSWALIKGNLAKLPKDCSWLQLYGVALLCGIGFTLSLFLGTLSFADEISYLAEVRMGVFIGSLLSGIVGAMVFIFVNHRESAID